MLNRVVITGNLTRDPQYRTDPETNTSNATFSIAVDEPTKGQEGKPQTSYFTVVVWNNQASAIAKNLRKGDTVGVDGRLRQRSWVSTKDGTKRTTIEIVATKVEFLVLRSKAKQDIPNEDFGYQSDEEEEVESSPALEFADEPENLDRESKNLETIEEPTDDDLPF